MAAGNRGLGRGINALFDSSAAEDVTDAKNTPLAYAPVDAILPNENQPRERFTPESLNELASSIAQYGILEPLLVRPGLEPGSYRLIAGERRLRAAKIAGLAEVPIVLRDLDDREALIVTLLENLQREDLNPIEEAKGLDALRNTLNLTMEAIAETLGKSRSSISNSLRLLKLPEAIQNAVADRRITISNAKMLSGMTDEDAVLRLGLRIIEASLTARETEDAVAFWNESHYFPWETPTEVDNEEPGQEEKPKLARDPQIGKLAESIGKFFNCRAKINGTQEKGRISLAYESNEQLFDLLDKLGLNMESSVQQQE